MEILGTLTQELLRDQNVLVVGAGAIGCEVMKNLALMGVGSVTVTDPDHIERSNLSRQFLFRGDDVGRPKSEVAARAARLMNSASNITAHNVK